MPLPWNAVNVTPPGAVAAHLPLERSPRGRRKFACPFCGGHNFSPLRRAWYCYSGCGGRAYGNVDTAAQFWSVSPAEACRRLADLLGIFAADPDPPWAEVARNSTEAAAAALGLPAAAGSGRRDCPACGGRETLRSYARRWRCGSATCLAGPERGWKGHVDIAMALWRTSATDACYRLAAALRGDPKPSSVTPRADAVPSGRRERALAAVRSRPGSREPPALYELLLGHLQLGELGRAELARRRIDPAAAAEFGFRSVEPGEWERRVLPLMAAFSDEELEAAGFPRSHVKRSPAAARRPWWPGWGRAPLLVIPVHDGMRLAGLRFRNLADPDSTRCPRYVSPKFANPDVPFNAAALETTAPALHVVEGELNAYVLLSSPYCAAAVGLPGAGTWQEAWSERIRDETTWVIGWFDADRAGRAGANRVRDSLARVRGLEWARARWRSVFLDRDTCDLHREWALASLLRQAPWTRQDADSLWSDHAPENPGSGGPAP